MGRFYITGLYKPLGAACCRLSLRSCGRLGSRQSRQASPQLTKTSPTITTLRYENPHIYTYSNSDMIAHKFCFFLLQIGPPVSFRISVSALSTCLCSVWTGQPRPPPAASTLPASPEREGRGLIREFGEAGKASSRGYRACRATSYAVTAAKQLPAGPPST